jgi:hypothetical protein
MVCEVDNKLRWVDWRSKTILEVFCIGFSCKDYDLWRMQCSLFYLQFECKHAFKYKSLKHNLKLPNSTFRNLELKKNFSKMAIHCCLRSDFKDLGCKNELNFTIKLPLIDS